MVVRYLIRRLVGMIPLLLLITALVFFLGQYGAGDEALNLTMQMNDGSFDPKLYQDLRHKLGEDEPAPIRFEQFVVGAAHGNFGVSYVLPGTPDIGQMIATSLPISLQLGLAAMVIVVIVGIPLGTLAAVWRNSFLDYLIVFVGTVLSATPAFVLAPIAMVLLVIQFHLLPTVAIGWQGLTNPNTLFPAACLAAGPLLQVVRFTRSSVINALSQEYVRAARARGLSEFRVVTGHVIKNAMTPVLTVLGLATAHVVSGSIFIETIFNIHGFGFVAVSAFQGGDVQTVAATTLVSALIIVTANLLVDLTYGALDPRVRLS
ncbi:MAG TPA: ABC transporter permease [Chloroflexota bacterium]|nr:ABC transporter permease [Chloroflexota bacterium]